MTTDLTQLSAKDLIDLYGRKSISPVEVSKAVLSHIETLQPYFNAYRTVDAAALTKLIVKDAQAEVRLAPVGALGFSEDDTVLPALLLGLTDHAWQVREEAALALGEIAAADALPALAQALRNSAPDVRNSFELPSRKLITE